MTVKEVVENVIKELGAIPVPVNQMESIGFPIARSIQGLNSCIDAWNEEEAKEQQEPVIELVPMEEGEQKNEDA